MGPALAAVAVPRVSDYGWSRASGVVHFRGFGSTEHLVAVK